MLSASTRISCVKNFVSKARSLVLALPLSQVKSAKAKGSDLTGFSASAGLATVETGSVDAADRISSRAGGGVAKFIRCGLAFETIATVGTGAGASPKAGCFPSNSATRFSSFSTRSRSQRSRSVNSGGGEGLAEFVVAGGESELGPSSAKENSGQHANSSKHARTILKIGTRIYFSW